MCLLTDGKHALLLPSIVPRLSIVIPLIFLLFFPLEDFPEENTDCQYDANFLDHSSVNMNEILCLDVGGDKYRDDDGLPGRMKMCNLTSTRIYFITTCLYHLLLFIHPLQSSHRVRRGCLTRLPHTRLGRLAREANGHYSS